MKFPFFASFIVFCLWLTYEIHKSGRKEEQSADAFWERESEANRTRRKPLDDLSYITIPFDTLPMDTMKDDPEIADCYDTLHSLSEEPIVNLTGISNTDLKLMYGAPNIGLLTQYDQRYTVLARTLQKLAVLLYQRGCIKDAEAILTFAVSTRTDVSASYRLLASIYKELGTPKKINDLIPVAEGLNSPMAPHIVSYLKDAADGHMPE